MPSRDINTITIRYWIMVKSLESYKTWAEATVSSISYNMLLKTCYQKANLFTGEYRKARPLVRFSLQFISTQLMTT